MAISIGKTLIAASSNTQACSHLPHPDGLRPAMDARMPEGSHEPVYQPMQVQPNQKVATPNRATMDYVPNPTTVPEAEQFPNLDLNIKGVK